MRVQSHRSRSRALFAGAAIATSVVATVTLTASTAVAGRQPAKGPARASGPGNGASIPVLDWHPCAPSTYDCATARVPLDYRRPRGATIELAVIRRKAADQRHRIGSLFFNSGGPGNPLTTYLPALYDRFPAQVRQRFDIIGFDPRGIGQSTAVQCFPNAAAEGEVLSKVAPGFPVSKKEERSTFAAYARFAKACADRAGGLIRHVSTANTARDMDLLRQAVGDPALSYYGLSYGTFLGVTYANMFPGRVRAMVLDAVLEPVAYTTGRGDEATRLGTALRLNADIGLAQVLDKFLTLCGQAGPSHCAFAAGGATGTKHKYRRLLARLRDHPVTIGQATYTYASTVAAVTSSLDAVTPIPGAADDGWPQAAGLLQRLWQATSTPASRAAGTAGEDRYTGPEQGGAVVCAESRNPRDTSTYARAAALGQARSGEVGRMMAWRTAPCATWPAVDRDRYTGPWNRRTAAPIMLINTTYDPADPYAGAVTTSRELARARLLTIDGYGHGALQNASGCADRYESAYLLAGTLPPPGTVCRQDHRPFE